LQLKLFELKLECTSLVVLSEEKQKAAKIEKNPQIIGSPGENRIQATE
jgi:hypothetical protein